MMRLARYCAKAGVASRRGAEELILAGRVSVNGLVQYSVATNIDETKDLVKVNGRAIHPEEYVYYLLHKPVGYVCTTKDSHARKVVTQLVPAKPRVYPVGRLDKDSSGLLLLTNDGDLALRLTHPRYAVPKVYEVTLDRPYQRALMAQLRRGIMLEEGRAVADAVTTLGPNGLRMTIHQGWNRQIRRMLEACGYLVIGLKRIAEGKVELGKLMAGGHRKVTKKEIVE